MKTLCGYYCCQWCSIICLALYKKKKEEERWRKILEEAEKNEAANMEGMDAMEGMEGMEMMEEPMMMMEEEM